MNELLQRLKQRRLVQWTLAYIAAAFALVRGIGGDDAGAGAQLLVIGPGEQAQFSVTTRNDPRLHALNGRAAILDRT